MLSSHYFLTNNCSLNLLRSFEAGETIVVDIVLTAHHGGHFELRGCPLGRASDQACFDEPGHTFMFVKDVLHDMPADPNYPERGYCKGGQASSIKDFSMEFKIPKGLVGEQVLLQVRLMRFVNDLHFVFCIMSSNKPFFTLF